MMPSSKTKNIKITKGSILYMWSLKFLKNIAVYVQKTAINRRLKSRRDKYLGIIAYYMVVEIKKKMNFPRVRKKVRKRNGQK